MATRYALVGIEEDGAVRVIHEAENFVYEYCSTANEEVVRLFDVKPYTDEELAHIDVFGVAPQSYATEKLVVASLALAAYGNNLVDPLPTHETVQLLRPADLGACMAECAAASKLGGEMYAVVLYDLHTGTIYGKWLGGGEAEVCEGDKAVIPVQ